MLEPDSAARRSTDTRASAPSVTDGSSTDAASEASRDRGRGGGWKNRQRSLSPLSGLSVRANDAPDDPPEDDNPSDIGAGAQDGGDFSGAPPNGAAATPEILAAPLPSARSSRPAPQSAVSAALEIEGHAPPQPTMSATLKRLKLPPMASPSQLGTVFKSAMKGQDEAEKPAPGTSNHLLDRDLPSPFLPVFRADSMAFIIREIRVSQAIAAESYFVARGKDGGLFVPNCTVRIKVRHLELETPVIAQLPLNAPVKIRFDFPVSYHCLIFDNIVLAVRRNGYYISKTRIPFGRLFSGSPEALMKPSGTHNLKMRSYEDARAVKGAREGNIGITKSVNLQDFASCSVEWSLSYTGVQALEYRNGPLGSFWHKSDVERWMLDGEPPPDGSVPDGADAVGPLSPISPASPKSGTGTIHGEVRRTGGGVDDAPAEAKTAADYIVRHDTGTSTKRRGTLLRSAASSSATLNEDTSAASSEKPKALGEIEPIWKSYQAGMRMSLGKLGFLLAAYRTVRQLHAAVPDPPFADPALRRALVDMERVKEARWWLKFSKAAYHASKAAPVLLPHHAERANLAAMKGFLKMEGMRILLYVEPEGAFTSRFIACWVEEKKAVVIAVRGTAGLMEALTDLNGEYVPFKNGVSHKGFVLSGTYLHNRYFERIRTWAAELRPRRIICTGHSYGGSVAAILSILLRDDLPALRQASGVPDLDIEAVTFGAAPTISAKLAPLAQHVDAYVNLRDPVPGLCYGSLLDLRELLIRSDALRAQKVPEEEVLARLLEARERLAAGSKLKLQVAGRVWMIRKAGGGKQAGKGQAPRTATEPVFASLGRLFKGTLPRAQAGAALPSTPTASFRELPHSEDAYIVEPRDPRDLFEVVFDPESALKPHALVSYGANLKAVCRGNNMG
ncbi:hypothetical protein DFJ74DRAFT_763650 [Hyaloraphidium curvatum]|nr:hypothetical protein DFJ74DRAFT_763650 [Hyaloraphidium curvatum]